MHPNKPHVPLDEFPSEEVLYQEHPAMFRNAPFRFALSVLLVPVFGIGLIILFFWWLDSRATTLSVTERRITLRKGILSKSLNDIQTADVRNIQVRQTVFQRMMGVGSIEISSAGQGTIEIAVNGIPDPDGVRQLINRTR